MGHDIVELTGIDCVLPLQPMFHVLAWGFPYSAMTLGCKLILVGNCKDFTRIVRTCCDEGVTLLTGVPTVIEALRSVLERNPIKYGKLRGQLTRILCGGSSPSPSMIKYYDNIWNIELIQAWGMTETSSLGTVARKIARRRDMTLSKDEQLLNQTKCGIFAPGIEGKILDCNDLDIELSHNEKNIGELVIKGPYITKKYYKINTPNKFTKDGYLITGDIAYINANEQMKIKDRSKDMIKSGGEWISSIDMENVIQSIPNIELACVIGVEHPKWTERPIVICKLTTNGNSIDNNEMKGKIMKLLTKYYAKFQLPDDILFVNDIPLTGSGKISKKIVRNNLKKNGYVLPDLRKKAKL